MRLFSNRLLLNLADLPLLGQFCPTSWKPEHQPDNMVYAPHWYGSFWSVVGIVPVLIVAHH